MPKKSRAKRKTLPPLRWLAPRLAGIALGGVRLGAAKAAGSARIMR